MSRTVFACKVNGVDVNRAYQSRYCLSLWDGRKV